MQDISSFSRKLESWNLKITEKQQEQFIITPFAIILNNL